ncbi:MAG: hypothetical protein ACTHLE_12600 [Agriterribacter sp.]
MALTRTDLKLTHYMWDEHYQESEVEIVPGRTIFDRNNGHHVLRVINWYVNQYEWLVKPDHASIELLLSDQLPLAQLSERSVCQWLANTSQQK